MLFKCGLFKTTFFNEGGEINKNIQDVRSSNSVCTKNIPEMHITNNWVF